MADSTEVLVNAGVFGVALPALLAGGVAVLGRFQPKVGAALVGIGAAAGYWVAHWRLAGSPAWPPVDATHWLPLSITLGAVIGLAGGLAHGTGGRRERVVSVVSGLAVLGSLLWLVRGLLASWLPRWESGQAYGEVLALAGLGTAAYVGFSRLLQIDNDRPRTFGAMVAVGGLVGGAAAAIGLARSVLLAQLLGAGAAAVGGLALAALAGVPGSVLRFSAASLALLLTIAVGAAQHYAELPRLGAITILIAPALIAAAMHLGSKRWVGMLAATAVSGAAVLGAAWLTARATGDDAAYAPPSGEAQVELDYGYGGGTGAEPSDDGAPDPYGDMKALENWKPAPPAPK